MTDNQIQTKYKSNWIQYENLSLDFLLKHKKEVVVIIYEEIEIYLKLSLNPEIKSLLVHSNGAYDPRKIQLPVFHRGKWSNLLKVNTIYISDPSLDGFIDRVNWCVGTENHHYLKSISQIIKKIGSLLSIKDNNFYYFGSSAGGFQSLLLSAMHRESTVIANNPQFEINFDRSFRFFLRKNPSDLSMEGFREKYYYRFSFYEYLKKTNYFPRIFYFVNVLSENDFDKQYKGFMNFISSVPEYIGKVEIIQYLAHNGHSGMYDKDKTIHFINNLVKSESPSNIEKKKPIRMNTFKIHNENDEYIAKYPLTDRTNSLYIPIKHFKKGYFASTNFRVNIDKGLFHLTLHSKYYTDKLSGQNILFYEILLNNKVLAYEDISHYSQKNFITIFNVKKDDQLTIKIHVCQNRTTDAWQRASILSIVSTSEVKSAMESSETITFTSPAMIKQ